MGKVLREIKLPFSDADYNLASEGELNLKYLLVDDEMRKAKCNRSLGIKVIIIIIIVIIIIIIRSGDEQVLLSNCSENSLHRG